MANKVIKITQIGHNLWRALEDTELNIFGGTIVIPKGFECDLASIPKCFQWFIPKRGKDIDVSLVHDYLYSEHSAYDINREEADAIFRRLLINAGMSTTKANIIHKSVRLFGESHYSEKKLCGIVTVERKALIDKRPIYKKHLEYIKRAFPELISEISR